MAFGDLKGTPLSVAANSVTNPTSATGSVALVAGDLIYAVCAEQTSTTATACSDNLGNTYTATQAGTVAAATVAGRAFWARAATNGTLTSVNFTCTASANNVVGIAAVIEGPFVASPLDANPTNITQDNTTPYTCPTTPTLAQASESVLCWIVHNGAPTFTASAPNTIALQLATQSILKLAIGRQTVAATTAVAPAFTSSAVPTSSVYGTTSFKADTAKILVADSGSYSITGTTASVLRGDLVAANAGTYAITGQDVALGYVPVPPPKVGPWGSAPWGYVAWGGMTRGPLAAYSFVADAGAYAITGQAVGLLHGNLITADAGAYAISGQTVNLLVGHLLVADAGAYNITGQNVSLIKPVLGAYTIALDTGSYLTTGQDATLLVGRVVVANAGSYAIAGQDVSLLLARLLTAASGVYTVTGQDAEIIYSPVAPPIAPSAGHWLDWAPTRPRVRGKVVARETALADQAHIDGKVLPLPPPPLELGDVALAEAGEDLAAVSGQVWVQGFLRSFEQGGDRARGYGKTMSVVLERSRGRITAFHFDLVENSLTLRSFEQRSDTALITWIEPPMPDPDPDPNDEADVQRMILMAAMNHGR